MPIYLTTDKMQYSRSCTYLESRVKHNQLGARGHNVIALVGFHEAHVNVALWFSSCERGKCRKRLSGEGAISKRNV